ncbi:type I secretion system permease/ATPase [Pseudooceanicola aestuarii]|uniref:type I secretion system permease/ATPase n=1 Tax=Pseudooceanicola aestuarii TaxID=2697319 RepID=UPI0013D3D9EF|nr:type I secretion system permease/ATPase [Pseudooceanicola aestuarii]
MSLDQHEIGQALRRETSGFAFAGLFSGAINLLYLSSPLYLMQIYNRVLVSENVTTLILLTLILLVALMTMGFLDAMRAQVLVRCGMRLDAALSTRVFGALIRKSAAQGFSRGARQLQRLDQFRTFITGPGVHFAFDLPWIPVYLIILFLIDPLLGTIATCGAAALFGLAMLNEKLTRPSLSASEQASNRAMGFSENILRHSDVVVAMGMRPAIEEHWRGDRDRMMITQAVASDRNAVVSSGIRFARLLLQALMLGTGAWLVIQGQILPATIFASSIILGRALVPVEQGVGTWKQFNEARSGYREVKALLAEVPPDRDRTVVPAASNTLSASDVSFRLTGQDKPILKEVSFDIAPGEAIGIVGPSGSGKSTLARLLIGAIAPLDGKLRYGGMDFDKWDRTELGRQIGYLPQDVGLFGGTVRDNISRFGDASVEEVIAAAKAAGIHDMIMDLPKHYDTPLGPDGVGLSGGQRQRLGLARALLGQPRLLVLDEPNANLDDRGEAGLAEALARLKAQGTTILLITHRMNVLEVADRLFFVRAGKLEAQGKPDAVLEHIRTNVVPEMQGAA